MTISIELMSLDQVTAFVLYRRKTESMVTLTALNTTDACSSSECQFHEHVTQYPRRSRTSCAFAARTDHHKTKPSFHDRLLRSTLFPSRTWFRELDNRFAMDNSPFNDLPAELRNRIYELALTQSCDILIGFKTARAGSITIVNADICNKHPLSLAQTCKRIRQECRQLFFAANVFSIRLQPCFVSDNDYDVDYDDDAYDDDVSATVRPLEMFLKAFKSQDIANIKLLQVELLPADCFFLYATPMRVLTQAVILVLQTSKKLAKSRVPVELKLTLDCFKARSEESVKREVIAGYNDGGRTFRKEFEKQEQELIELAGHDRFARGRLQDWKVQVFRALEVNQAEGISE